MKEDTTPINPTWMSKTGGYAKEMTLRDHFAAEAMRFSLFEKTSYESMNDVATHAYEVADAMLAARDKS